MLRVRYANMLLIEIESIGLVVSRIQNSSSDHPTPIQAASNSVYTGLVNSTNISYFDTTIQYELHKLYALVGRHNTAFQSWLDDVHDTRMLIRQSDVNDLLSKVEILTRFVSEFYYEHLPGRSTRWLAKLFGLLDADYSADH